MQVPSRIYFILVALVLFQIGCATRPHTLSETKKTRIETVGVIGGNFEPECNLQGFIKGRWAGLGAGAVSGAAGGLMASLYTGPFAPFFAPVFVGAGALVGGTAGAVDAMPMDNVKEIEDSVSDLLESFDPQQDFVDHIMEEAGKIDHLLFLPVSEPRAVNPEATIDYRNYFERGVDTILEIYVLKVGLVRGETDRKHFSFDMTVQGRLISTIDGEELYSNDHYFRGKEKTLPEWTNNNALLLREEWGKCYRVLSKDVVERVFKVTDLEPKNSTGYCWLKPSYPKSKLRLDQKLKFVKIKSIQPTFTWEAFPREGDILNSSKNQTNRIENVTYEIKIWKINEESQKEIIYLRNGIPEPSHTLDKTLDFGTKYYWTMRAHYFINGQERLTGWSYSRNPGIQTCDEAIIPIRNYFRFKTDG